MTATRDLLAAMVAMDTTSRRSNLDLVAYIEQLLDHHDVPHARVPSPDGQKANLLARVGPDLPGGVVLSAHLDCVPVEGQPWTFDPFALTEADGRLYGRGTADMKGFLAVVLAHLPMMVSAPLARPILLALTYDEEIGTVGAPSAVRELLGHYARPDAVIVGEPTSMEVVTAHKGVRAFRITVEGLDGHSSQPHRASNAIAAVARLATYIDDLAAQHRDAAGDPRFEPPYTTFNLAMIEGGQAINIVPRHAELVFEYRPVPADDSRDIRDRIAAFADEQVLPLLRAATGVGQVDIADLSVALTLATEQDGTAERLVRTLSDQPGPGRTVPFATDGGHFQAAGLSTVVLGPGSIDQAHMPDEWIALDQLAACERFIGDLVTHLTTGA